MEHVTRELNKYKMICNEREFLIKRDARVEKLQASSLFWEKEATTQRKKVDDQIIKLKDLVKKVGELGLENETLSRTLKK